MVCHGLTIFRIEENKPNLLYRQSRQIRLYELRQPNYHHISNTGHGTKCTNTSHQSVRFTDACAARSRRRLHKRLGRCPPTSPFSPVQIGRGSTGPRRSHTADRRAPASSHVAHAHTRACTSTVAEIRNDSCHAPPLRSDVTLTPSVWNERPLRHPPTSRFPPIKGKTLTLMASQVGGGGALH